MANQPDLTTLLSGANAPFIAELYGRYLEDPQAVDPSWRNFFAELRDEPESIHAEIKGASWAPRGASVIGVADPEAAAAKGKRPNGAAAVGAISAEQVRAATLDSIRALMLIRAYRINGHLIAHLDPLGIEK